MTHPSLHPVLATEVPGAEYVHPRGSCPGCGGTGIARRPRDPDQVGCTCARSRRYEPALLDLIEVVSQCAAAWLDRHAAAGWGTCYLNGKPFCLEWRDQHRRGDGGGCDLALDMPIAVAELIGLLDPPTVLRLVHLARRGLQRAMRFGSSRRKRRAHLPGDESPKDNAARLARENPGLTVRHLRTLARCRRGTAMVALREARALANASARDGE